MMTELSEAGFFYQRFWWRKKKDEWVFAVGNEIDKYAKTFCATMPTATAAVRNVYLQFQDWKKRAS